MAMTGSPLSFSHSRAAENSSSSSLDRALALSGRFSTIHEMGVSCSTRIDVKTGKSDVMRVLLVRSCWSRWSEPSSLPRSRVGWLQQVGQPASEQVLGLGDD